MIARLDNGFEQLVDRDVEEVPMSPIAPIAPVPTYAPLHMDSRPNTQRAVSAV